MAKLSLKLPKHNQDKFFEEWIAFFVEFMGVVKRDDVEQIVFNLWEELPVTPHVDRVIAKGAIKEVGENLELEDALTERYYLNFDSAPISEGLNKKDLWDIGDSLRPHIKQEDIEKVLEQLVNISDDKYDFSVTSFAKGYKVMMFERNRYTRFFV